MTEGSHHVLHDLINRKLIDEETKECILPVLDALNHFEAEIQTESAASQALKILAANK